MSLREQAYDSFTTHLLSRRIQSGQFISQRELTQILDVPLGAVREMIPRLEADGLIRTMPHRGLQVAPVDMGFIRNAFQLRHMLEREAVAEFAVNAPAEEIENLRKAHEEVRAQGVEGVTPELLAHAQDMDWRMHQRMIDALGNELVSGIYRTNLIKIRLIRSEDTRMLPELLVAVMDEHLAIIDALANRDSQAAVQALDMHIDSARQRVLRI
ncbi:GntR family transcriptional regulator [Halomonas sp. HL-93]|uniref:GntR family transcriptional regulator n=1 Tax=Halomonas sp. HL-93 TaxID=1666906 RepID=UPI0006DA1648|nr:GntR family transcriptional regulator [Halomonas sp. HL-93]KPQ21519.1 MAG: GntR family transcriptional regulator [Halomonas sp. HL-93]SBR52098.1 transcriptional regulator, GntR family [Halomonas sp. HL-93]